MESQPSSSTSKREKRGERVNGMDEINNGRKKGSQITGWREGNKQQINKK